MNIQQNNATKRRSLSKQLRGWLMLWACLGMYIPMSAAPMPAPCPASSQSQTTWISNVLAHTPSQVYYSNPSQASAYSDFTNPCIPYDNSIPLLNLGVQVSTSGQYLGIWIDYNDDGVFDANELINQGLAQTNPMTGTGVNIGLANIYSGTLAMRIILSADPIFDPCANVAVGEVEDYTLCFDQCNPHSTNQNAWIANVRVRTPQQTFYSNPSGASSYSDFTNPCMPFDQSIPGNLLSFTTSQPGLYLGVWIDENNNGEFEANELLNPFLAQNSPMTGTGVNMSPGITYSGTLAMRVITSTQPIPDACSVVADGEVEDYTICFDQCDPQSVSQNAWIANVEVRTPAQTFYSNPSGASAYSDFTNPCMPFDQSIPSNLLSFTTSQPGLYLGVWIDANDNGVFEANELLNPGLAQTNPMTGTTVNISPGLTYSGTLAMRVITSTQPITDACSWVLDGEIEDYTICFDQCDPQSVDQSVWVSNVEVRTPTQTFYSNPSGASAYSDFTNPCMPFDQTIPNNLLSFTVSQPGLYLGVWIDENNNGVFEASELLNPGLAQTNPMTGTTVNISPGVTYSGNLAMRVIVSTDPILDACSWIANGEIEDYTICFEDCKAGSAAQNVWVSNVSVITPTQNFYSNPSGPSDYSDFTNPCIPFDQSIANIVLSIQASQPGLFLGVWIDANGNGIYETNELLNPGLAQTNPMGGTGVNIGLGGTYSGTLAMRIILSTEPITSPCGEIADGEVEDYTICFDDGCKPESREQQAWITNVRSRTPWQVFYANPSGPSAYSDFTNPCIPYDFNEQWIVLSINTSQAGMFLGIWIDQNGNGVFENNELLSPALAQTNPMNGTGINISLPNIYTGTVAMRLILSSDPIFDPCEDILNGEVEDYTICFTDGGDKGEGRKTAEITYDNLSASLAPNPASDVARLHLDLPAASDLSIQVVDLQGKVVLAPATGERFERGQHDLRLRVQGLDSGMYFVRIQSGTETLTLKLMVL